MRAWRTGVLMKIKRFRNKDAGNGSSSRRRFFLPALVLLAALSFQLLLAAADDPHANAYDYGGYAYGPSNYYFPWYDTKGGKTWVLVSQPSTGSRAVDNYFDVYLRSADSLTMNLMTPSTVNVLPGNTNYQYFSGNRSGPVNVATGKPALVSERSLFGNSFEEIWSKSYEELSSHYWWPVYDSKTAGMKNWVLVANPVENAEPVKVRLCIHNVGCYENTLAAGEYWTPIYPGVSGGPVEVTAWSASGNPANPSDARKVIASQRVLYNGAFNEMPGMANSELDSFYLWTWYDDYSPGASNWVVLSNPHLYPIFGVVMIGNLNNLDDADPNNDPYIYYDWIPERQNLAVRADIMGGPVFAMACTDINCNSFESFAASQRILWGPSFSEIAGSTEAEASYSQFCWTWYDQKSFGSVNWVLMSNPSDYPIYAEVKIKGQKVWQGTIPSYENRTPTFPGRMDGPVEVEAWTSVSKAYPAPVFASQRVLWNGYFNEIVGKGL